MSDTKPMLKNKGVFSVIEYRVTHWSFSFLNIQMQMLAVKLIVPNLSLTHQKYSLFHTELIPTKTKKESVVLLS